MAGIFNLFGGTSLAAKQNSLFGSNDSSVKSVMKPTIFGNAGAMPGKNAGLTPAKPRGLSMRTMSELNVVRGSGNGERSPRKKSPSKAVAKAYFEPSDCVSKQLSPRNKDKISKMQIMKSKQLKAQSSKSKSPDNELTNEKKQAEDTIFKKPLAPSFCSRRSVDPYREPEKLSFYYDEKNIFECTIDPVDQEFIDFMRVSKAIKPYEDEGFESDPELISVAARIDDDLKISPVKPDSIELSALSDDDDDFLD